MGCWRNFYKGCVIIMTASGQFLLSIMVLVVVIGLIIGIYEKDGWASSEMRGATWKGWLGAIGGSLYLSAGVPILYGAVSLIRVYPVPTIISFFFVLYLFIRNHVKKPRTAEDDILGAGLLIIVLLLFLQFYRMAFYGQGVGLG